MSTLFKIFKTLLYTSLFLIILTAITITGVYYYINPDLPSVDNAQTYELDAPLRIYSKEEKLIAEFGILKREPIIFKNIPQYMTQAIIASEDSRFYEHPGVDYRGILRAVVNLIKTGKKGQGGSTITMQVARNFFLSNKKTYLRKIREIFLSFKLEQRFSKEEILELYLNKIYLGHRAYGIATAAKIYYGKKIGELNLPQLAMIAGLPKAPSKYNPITNKKRATIRRNYVLNRMFELNFISKSEFDEASNSIDNALLHTAKIELDAPYIAEMARAWLKENKIGKGNDTALIQDIYTGGYKIYTTVNTSLQQQADKALRETLLEYDRRHGYKGVIRHIPNLNFTDQVNIDELALNQKNQFIQELRKVKNPGQLIAAIVLQTLSSDKDKQQNSAKLFIIDKNSDGGFSDGKIVNLYWEGVSWAAKYLSETRKGHPPKQINDVINVGDVIYLESHVKENNSTTFYRLAQIPAVEGAIISLKPRTGEILALSGGFDFYNSKYNRATQAKRQPGSNFKPFVYSAALSQEYTTASTINDAPIVFKDKKLEGSWRPSNYSGKFFGPTRMRKALYKSRNMVSIKLLMEVGINFTLNYVENFGFDAKVLPHNLSLALGNASLTPLEVARGYAIIANGGYKITPWFIDRIVNKNEEVVYQFTPKVSCSSYYDKDLCPEDTNQQAKNSVKEENLFLITSMLKDVIKRGTGRKALTLKRKDIAGKTGTTNEQVDAWFSGYTPMVSTTTWVGFDQPRSMGRYETGGRAALPMWIKYMKHALNGTNEEIIPEPENIITVKIDEKTGLLANNKSKKTLFEFFILGTEPQEEKMVENDIIEQSIIENINEELF